MKKYILAAASAVALSLAVPAVASAQTGYIDLTYSNIDAGGFDADGFTVGGALLAPVGSLNLQFDAQIGEIEDSSSTAAAVHLFHRNDSWAFGGVPGLVDGEDSDSVTTYGLEAAKYFEQATLGGGVSFIDEDGLEATIIDVGLKFFPSDNLSLGGHIGNVDVDGAGDADVFGLNAEYKFDASPISLFAGWDSVDDADLDMWSLGIRMNFGHDTLKDRDRNGASMGSASAARLLF